MTLVVGRVDGPRIAVASDTLITEHDRPLALQDGVIKSCMLPGDVCVSFCNSPVSAERAFKEFAARFPRGASFSNVVLFFEQSSRETGNDYLIAFCHPAHLVKITEGKRIESASKTAWIGDQAAYSRFRAYSARKIRQPQQGRAINAALFLDEMTKSPASDLYSAMRNVVLDRTIPTVGGFVPTISNRDNGFRFSVYSDMLYDWPSWEPEEYQFKLEDPVAFQSNDENAGYAVAQISPGYTNLNLVAFYFSKARKLFFFYGKDNGLPNHCEIFQNVPASNIHTALNKFVGADLAWLLTITTPRSSTSGLGVTSGIEKPGSQFTFLTEANTFPNPNVPGGATKAQ
jgi:hypothetical protein